MKLVATMPAAHLHEGEMVRLPYAPYDILVALVDGIPYAIENACNHAGASLCEGPREGDRVLCPMHGYVFSLKTGALLAPEGLCGDQRRFEVRVEGDEIRVYDPFYVDIF